MASVSPLERQWLVGAPLISRLGAIPFERDARRSGHRDADAPRAGGHVDTGRGDGDLLRVGGLLARTFGVTAPFWFAFAGSALFVVLIWRELRHVAHADETDAHLAASLAGDASPR
jgi:hypothetical protein